MLAVRLVKHALRMITGNLSQALRASIVPFLLLAAAFVIVLGLGGFGDPTRFLASPAPSVFLIFVLIPLAMFVFGWVAVTWHRYILLEEQTGWIPQISGRPIWPYVGTTFLWVLRVFVVAIPLMLIVGSLASGMLASGGVPIFALLIMSAVNILLSYIGMRWALPLPAKAIGSEMRFSDSWKATKPLGAAIFGVVVTLLVFNMLISFVAGLLSIVLPAIIGFILNAAASWLTGMLGISILTTLYGHIVEGRDLP